MRILTRVFYVLTLAVLLFGCAHVTAVANACKPTPADVDTALADLQSDGWQAALEQLALAKGICVVNAAVSQVVAALNGGQALQMPDGTPSSSDIVTRGRTWLATHPN